MKKLFLTIIAATTLLTAKAQKLEKPYIDHIKGDTAQATQSEAIFNNWKKLSVSSVAIKLHDHSPKGYSIRLELVEVGGSYNILSQDTKVYFKLDDGSIVELTPNLKAYSEIATKLVSLQYGTHATNVSLLLTDEQYKQLTTHKVVFVQINTTNSGNREFEIKDSKADIIQKQLLFVAQQ